MGGADRTPVRSRQRGDAPQDHEPEGLSGTARPLCRPTSQAHQYCLFLCLSVAGLLRLATGGGARTSGDPLRRDDDRSVGEETLRERPARTRRRLARRSRQGRRGSGLSHSRPLRLFAGCAPRTLCQARLRLVPGARSRNPSGAQERSSDHPAHRLRIACQDERCDPGPVDGGDGSLHRPRMARRRRCRPPRSIR